jgi:hypothetical protein
MISAADTRRPIIAVMKTPRELTTVSRAAASRGLTAFSNSCARRERASALV